MNDHLQPTHHAVLRLGLELKLYETLVEDNGAPKSVVQLAAPCNAEPLLVCECVFFSWFLETRLRQGCLSNHCLRSPARMMKHLAAMGTVREVDVDTYAPTPLTHSLTTPTVQDTVRFL